MPLIWFDHSFHYRANTVSEDTMTKYTQEDLKHIDMLFEMIIGLETLQALYAFISAKDEPELPNSLIEIRQVRKQNEDAIKQCQPNAWNLTLELKERLQVLPLAPIDEVTLLLHWARVSTLLMFDDYKDGIELLISLMETACQSQDSNLMLVGVKLAFIIFSNALLKNKYADNINKVAFECTRIATDSEFSNSFEAKDKDLARKLFLIMITLTTPVPTTAAGGYVIENATNNLAMSIDKITSSKFHIFKWTKKLFENTKNA